MPSERDPDHSDDGLNLKKGTVVTTHKNAFVVGRLLGEGGFGKKTGSNNNNGYLQVYDQNEPTKFYAMKVEKKLDHRRHSKLKMEVSILKMVSEERTSETSHFTAIIDRGKKEKYFFLVMSLVGKSLDDLKKMRPSRVFSIGTGLGAAIQCLEAIEDLTKHGYIHRDIKPANYACGLGKLIRTVYLLDFGIARRILNDENELKTPRNQVGFKGTVRFASVNCHRNLELGPRDDVESWFYLLLDLVVSTGLPWRRCGDKHEVQRVKEECRLPEMRERLFFGVQCKHQFGKMLDYISNLNYSDKVDYKFLYGNCREGAIACEVKLEDPYDWEDEQKQSSVSKKRSIRTVRFQ
ncbi:Protein kinase domain-containing protein [Aphelenchoides besseyi]|nr:Protein kinase domain-containing protein [Aphelenchoides besseyi]